METDIRELLAEDDLFDPFDEEEESPDEQPLVGAPLEEADVAPAVAEAQGAPDTRTPQEHFEDLMKSMPGQRRTLLALVGYCREPKTGAEMDVRTSELLEYNFSVYSPVVFRELLENAGAIRYVPLDEPPVPDGAAAAAQETGEPQGACASVPADGGEVVSERYFDGEEEVEIDFLEVPEERPGLWQATPEGLEVVDAQDDEGAIRELLGKEPVYLDIYHQILDYCCEQGGRSAKELDRLVNGSPLLEEPRRYSGYFVGRLERKGALEWRGGWCTTDAGRAMIEEACAQVGK